jgi:hypothetical protein
VLRSPRFWLGVAGVWLVAAGLAHLVFHIWAYVLGNGVGGMREFAVAAMKQAQSPNPLRPSLWQQFRLFSVSFGLLQVFAGSANLVLAGSRPSNASLRAFALFATMFWTLTFVPFAFIDPVIQGLVVAMVAVPLHAIAYLTATLAGD